ncbi:MAG TPA: PGPGW domain-containing protein [Thiolinea sp.]|nr:PGPGW domain-containing protein [Thiolinea sp.]
MDALINTLGDFRPLFFWLGIISLLVFLLSLLSLPWLLCRIPADYFSRTPESFHWSTLLHPFTLLRNLLGLLILCSGIAMLILPGQGLLTILIGIAIMQFPGRTRLERWLVSRKGVLKTINWFRRRGNVPELEPPTRL